MSITTPSALQGLRVIEMGQLIAGPFAGKTLGEFGADVIKIEAPDAGDPLRNWRLIKTAPPSGGGAVAQQALDRVDLRSAEGQRSRADRGQRR
jgi:formyl-CoA transferase